MKNLKRTKRMRKPMLLCLNNKRKGDWPQKEQQQKKKQGNNKVPA